MKKHTFEVPSIACGDCAKSITDVIKVADSDAKVNVDVEKKMVNVESDMSDESIRQAIQSVGYKIASY